MSALAPSVAVRRRGGITRRQVVLLSAIAASVVLPPLLSRLGLLTELWAFVIGIGVAYALMAISLNLLMGYAGQISLGHAGFLGVGAYVSGLLTSRYWVPNLSALLIAGAVGGVIALVVGLPALRLRGLYLAITTIAFVVMMEESILQVPAFSRGSAGVTLPRPEAWGLTLTNNADYLSYLLVFLVLFWAVDTNVVRSRLGRAFQGLREDEQVASAFGVDVSGAKLQAFVISGVLAGLAGALFGHLLLFANSSVFDLEFSLLLLAFVVVGGLGNRTGVVVAAVAFGVMPQLMQTVIEREAWQEALIGWEYIIGAALLIFTVARHPDGLAHAFKEMREAKASARARAGEIDEVDELVELPRFSLPDGDHEPRHGLRSGDTMLAVEDVTVRFGGLTAVDGASIWVPNGVIVGLIGPNGAGKTTLFNAVSGFQSIDAGRVEFLGREIQGLAPHARSRLGIGRTFQRGGLAAKLSVEDNLLLAQHAFAGYDTVSALVNLPEAADVERRLRARARQVIADLGFQAYSDTPVRHLSGGQRRIVEMACALVTSPELLLLDEPSAGMAPGVVEDLAQRLREIRDRLRRTVLLVEHHIPLVLDVCDLVYVLDHGVVIAQGRPDEVVKRPEVLEAYLGRRGVREGASV